MSSEKLADAPVNDQRPADPVKENNVEENDSESAVKKPKLDEGEGVSKKSRNSHSKLKPDAKVMAEAKAVYGDIDLSEGRRLRKRSDPPKVEEKKPPPRKASRRKSGKEEEKEVDADLEPTENGDLEAKDTDPDEKTDNTDKNDYEGKEPEKDESKAKDPEQVESKAKEPEQVESKAKSIEEKPEMKKTTDEAKVVE